MHVCKVEGPMLRNDLFVPMKLFKYEHMHVKILYKSNERLLRYCDFKVCSFSPCSSHGITLMRSQTRGKFIPSCYYIRVTVHQICIIFPHAYFISIQFDSVADQIT